MINRIVLVTKHTRLQDLVEQYLTETAAAFSIESQGQSFELYRQEHAIYEQAIRVIQSQIPNEIPVVHVERKKLPHTEFRENDLIIACGPDGLFANLAKYLNDQPVLTVNPDPKTVAGILMLFRPDKVGSIIQAVLKEEHQIEALPFIKAKILNETLWAINDVFIGRFDHVSARYRISYKGISESQSSSGILVSTGTGATGWMKSIATMVTQIAGNPRHALCNLPDPTDEELQFVVREPFSSPNTGANVVVGSICPDKPLLVTSEMANGGCVFSDGVIEQALIWEAGSTVEISVGERFVNRIIHPGT